MKDFLQGKTAFFQNPAGSCVVLDHVGLQTPDFFIRSSIDHVLHHLGAVALIPTIRIKKYGHGARIRLIFLLLQRRNAHRGFILCQTDEPAGIAGFCILIKIVLVCL